ncbi:13966_t:CDS:2, partial [Dentiscutata heterogama]
PAPRTEFMSDIISDKVYYYGGFGANGAMNDFFYIDLTQPFYSFSPPYQFIKYLDYRGGASANSDANNIYLFGGYGISSDPPPGELYIIQSLSTDPVINYIQDTNSTPSSRKWHTSVVDHKNKKIPIITQSDGAMYIYDIEQSVWTSNPTPNQPIGRQFHTATLLPDGRIIMIGGAFSSDVGQTATKYGFIPPIGSHSATLLPDNQNIIIYGGSNQTEYSGLAVLNSVSYVWTVISPNGSAPSLLSSGHKATLYFDVIIFAFGEYSFNNSRYLMDTTVRILNISNGQYRWVDSFTPPPTPPPTPLPTTLPTQNKSTNIQNPNVQISNSNIIIIVSTIGGTICIGILVLIGYIIYKKNRSREFRYVTESSNEIRYVTESNNEVR